MKSARVYPKSYRKGFVPIIIIIVVVASIALAAGGFYLKTKPKTESPQSQTTSPSESPSASASTSNSKPTTTNTQPAPKSSSNPQTSPAEQISIPPKTYNAGDFKVTISCRPYAPKVVFNWPDQDDETGYYLDINDAAWTGKSTPSGWVFAKVGANTTTYTWDTSRGLEGADYPTPQNSKTYWWRLRVFNDSTATYQSRDLYPGTNNNPPGDSFETPNCVPNASSYSLSGPPQDITVKLGQSSGIIPVLRDNFGNVVLHQEDFTYSWSQESSKVKLVILSTCTNDIQPPCPNAQAILNSQFIGLDKVIVTVKRKSTGQEVASATYNITVN
ncbi:MAG: hypothetical protein UT84_C0002G0088 [Candidatus Curtissbacteria bacterium GW2011_GWA1_40_16]|uniref:Uncharacterized protein n=1 Tax=Candidatus Curtissbacteria bacterium GW2011_GWA1_40_16 TaxID=1618405 RepID=A0A0G0ULY8_9BACT|nr:MAG: hypothetical protein UT84_C0002G0088 [Candidatus Curtissbacteria bacterium GW2011_GWA1_40_16]